jgi:hypothetical protein
MHCLSARTARLDEGSLNLEIMDLQELGSIYRISKKQQATIVDVIFILYGVKLMNALSFRLSICALLCPNGKSCYTNRHCAPVSDST